MPALPPHRPSCPGAQRTRPLPDPAAVRLCFIPDPAPPFDGEAGAGSPSAAWQGAGDPGTAPPGSPRPGTWPAGARQPAAAQPGNAGQPAWVVPPGPAGAPGWPGRFAQVLAETLAGSRPPRQIEPWTTRQVRDRIQRLGAQLSSPQRPRVRRVVTFRPASDVLEMTVVVGFGPRVRALAVRLEREDPGATGGAPPASPRWLCTAVEAA
jgi:Family of unknown function (DUF6459)